MHCARRLAILTLRVVLVVAAAERPTLAQVCDPPGPPPRFGCQWSTTDCVWYCAVCDPFGPPPRSSCGWSLDTCNWTCPGYTGVDVMVRTTHRPTQNAVVYVELSSLCTTTGAGATCGGSFAVSSGMTVSAKCQAIANVIASNCAAAGYALSSDDCASEASFTASNVLCPGTPFAIGISNDPNDFDQTDAGPLGDGEAETICAPPPGWVSTLRLEKSGGASLRLTWNDAAHDDGYLVYEDQAAGGNFDSTVGAVPSGITGLTLPMPTQNEFFLVAGNNATCGTGPKH